MAIKKGSSVRSYDFPGIRKDCFVEGVVHSISGDIATIMVDREVSEGRDMNVPPRVVKAYLGKHFLTKAYGVVEIAGL